MWSITGIVKSNYLCALGLTPYLFHYLDTGSLSALIVYINGMTFHLIFPHNFYMKWYDISCNAILIIYGNLYAMNVFVTLWSLYGTIHFMYNVPIPGYEIIEPIVHVLFVQLSLHHALVLSGI